VQQPGTKRRAGAVDEWVRCRILLISGSLRAESTNTAVLRTAVGLAPAGVVSVLHDRLGHLPAFNPDLEADLPAAAVELRAEIHAADALLFSVPEYAGALPGSLKNLLDWTIGDADHRSIYEKPVAWINPSPRGAVGAHRELRTVLSYAHATIVEPACVSIGVTSSDIEDGTIRATATRAGIARALATLAAHACAAQSARSIA
jgi:NAD(P)H-dependent FMN reductase